MPAMSLPRHPYVPMRMSDSERAAGSARFLEVMSRRRSIREFATTPVPRTLVVNAIRAAALAPSGANQQPWTFVLIGNAPDLRARIREAAEAEEREAEIITSYMPEQLSDEDLHAIVGDAVAESGAASPKEMGKVMSMVMPKVEGRADGRRVSQAVKEKLTA